MSRLDLPRVMAYKDSIFQDDVLIRVVNRVDGGVVVAFRGSYENGEGERSTMDEPVENEILSSL